MTGDKKATLLGNVPELLASKSSQPNSVTLRKQNLAAAKSIIEEAVRIYTFVLSSSYRTL